MINAVRTAAAVLFLVGYIPLSAVIGFPWTFITGNADVMYGLAMIGARMALRLAGIKVVTQGREQLDPRQNFIFMCNHVSNVDPPVVIPALPGRTSPGSSWPSRPYCPLSAARPACCSAPALPPACLRFGTGA